MDNAIPLCMFNNEQTGELLLKGVIDLQRNLRCGPDASCSLKKISQEA